MENTMMRAYLFLSLLMAIFTGCFSVAPQDERVVDVRNLLQEFSNDDIYWDGDFMGLTPSIVGYPSQELLNYDDDEVMHNLMRSLKKRDQFVAAHVLLTKKSGVDYLINECMWNGLHVEIEHTGKTSFLTDDMEILFEAWQSWFSDDKPKSGLIFGRSRDPKQ